MKATELRIGNLINRRLVSNELLAQCEFEPTEVTADILKDFISIIWDYEPIPLTEEWLLKFGASPRFERTEFIQNRFRLIWKEAYKYWYVIDADSLSYLSKVEFVHEWQNLYFSMNGEELTLKE